MVSKNILTKLLLSFVILAAAVLWLLSILEATKDTFGWFSLAWAVVMITGVSGVVLIVSGIFNKNIVTLKKMRIFFGAGLLIAALFALSWAIFMPGEIILPIIAIVFAAAVFVAIIATGGKKWDQGDNKNIGYKNYHQRKAEEEKKNKTEKE